MSVELQQKQRTFLRERFLRLLASIRDQRAQFCLVNGNTVFARFCVSDLDILQFQVSALESPLGVLPMAVLRSPDIISFTVSLPEDKSTDASWFVASSENDCCCVIRMLRCLSQFCIALHCTFKVQPVETGCTLLSVLMHILFNVISFVAFTFNTVSWCIHQEFSSLQLLCY